MVCLFQLDNKSLFLGNICHSAHPPTQSSQLWQPCRSIPNRRRRICTPAHLHAHVIPIRVIARIHILIGVKLDRHAAVEPAVAEVSAAAAKCGWATWIGVDDEGEAVGAVAADGEGEGGEEAEGEGEGVGEEGAAGEVSARGGQQY